MYMNGKTMHIFLLSYIFIPFNNYKDVEIHVYSLFGQTSKINLFWKVLFDDKNLCLANQFEKKNWEPISVCQALKKCF